MKEPPLRSLTAWSQGRTSATRPAKISVVDAIHKVHKVYLEDRIEWMNARVETSYYFLIKLVSVLSQLSLSYPYLSMLSHVYLCWGLQLSYIQTGTDFGIIYLILHSAENAFGKASHGLFSRFSYSLHAEDPTSTSFLYWLPNYPATCSTQKHQFNCTRQSCAKEKFAIMDVDNEHFAATCGFYWLVDVRVRR